MNTDNVKSVFSVSRKLKMCDDKMIAAKTVWIFIFIFSIGLTLIQRLET